MKLKPHSSGTFLSNLIIELTLTEANAILKKRQKLSKLSKIYSYEPAKIIYNKPNQRI